MTVATLVRTSVLLGRRILVAEDDYMIAREMIDMLSEVGAEAVGPVSAPGDGLELLALEADRIDAALLDVNLGGRPVWPLVDKLRAHDVPVVLASGYDSGTIPAAYADMPLCEKPATSRSLIRALERALTS